MEKILVTKSFLPPIALYEKYLKIIWGNSQLTNQGPLLLELEKKIKNFLGITYFHFLTNGTLALQLSLRALDITEGEIITTPFSYVATTSSILWERCIPVFVDIDPETLCINPEKIESAITKKTKAIMAVHVFGYPCNVEKIEAIAKKHKLKIIYDGAHSFGVKYKNKSLMSYGDITMGSFHATKVFHTIEGGCLVTNNQKINEKIDLIKRFGHNKDDHISLGINAKASEFQAAMGLCNLKFTKLIINKRKQISNVYDKYLIKYVKIPKKNKNVEYNYAYYPIILKNETETLKVIAALNNKNIFPRRYFYPSLNTIGYVSSIKKQKCQVSEDISKRILCLPLYDSLSKKKTGEICSIIIKAIC